MSKYKGAIVSTCLTQSIFWMIQSFGNGHWCISAAGSLLLLGLNLLSWL